MLEVACGLICSSLPALKPFAMHYHLEKRLKAFLRLPTRKASSATSTSQSRLFKRAPSDPESTMFSGTLKATSNAQVTWTSDAPAVCGRRTSRSLESAKTVESVKEQEAHELEAVVSPGNHSMWINVRSSVTIERRRLDEDD